MARGLGTEQRWLLDYVAGEPNGRVEPDEAGHPLPRWSRLLDAAKVRHGEAPTPAQLESMRRAARTLAKRGLIELDTAGITPERIAVPGRRWTRAAPTRRATFVRRLTTAAEWRAAIDHARGELANAPDDYHGEWVPTKRYWKFQLGWLEHELAKRS